MLRSSLPAQLVCGSQVPASAAAAESLRGMGEEGSTFLPCNPELLPSNCERGPPGPGGRHEPLPAMAPAPGGRVEPGREL